MAHFAEIDSNNRVLRVIVVSDEYESYGSQWCHDTFGGTWIQTSYTGKIRKNYAGIGYHYDSYLDAFISPQPFLSWILNTNTCNWEPPKPYPNDGKFYIWDEFIKNWKLING